MATRRRASLEAKELTELPMKHGRMPYTQEAYEDFRRRHSRQNKEIIGENALRRTTINALQDDIKNLHNEMLVVMRTNVMLKAQIKKMKLEQQTLCGAATKDVLDQIISAMPLLQQLRDNLSSKAISPSLSLPMATYTLRSNENPVATRPAAVGAANVVMGTLAETSEYGSDASEIAVDENLLSAGHVPLQSLAQRSGHPTQASSFTVAESSKGSTSLQAPPIPASPSLTSFPRSPSLPRVAAKRRESGVVISRGTLFPPSADTDHDISAAPTITPHMPSGVTQRRKGRTSSAVANVKISQIAAGLASESSSASSTPPSSRGWGSSSGRESSAEPPAGSGTVVQGVSGSSHTALDGVSQPSSSSSGSAVARPAHLGLSEAETVDDGNRGRRVRRSVNYKEPSLTKKMRKPDGLSLEETLRLPASRLSLDAQALSDANVGRTPRLPSKRTIGASTTRVGDLRRKSVLPRNGERTVGLDRDEETDEEEIDSALDLALGGIELDEDDFASGGTVPSDRNDTGPASKQALTETVPRRTPPRAPTSFKASSSRPSTRTSPRKKLTAPSTVRKAPSSTARSEKPLSSGSAKPRSRDALTENNENLETDSDASSRPTKAGRIPRKTLDTVATSNGGAKSVTANGREKTVTRRRLTSAS